jgi:HSF-type DNA-binding
MNHSYRDFSKVPPEIGYEHPRRIEDMSFSEKVHDILSDPSYASYIGWCDHGRAFKILVPVRLEQSRCLMKYFGNDRYSSFLRQLSNYGFKHITQGRDRNAYYHEVRINELSILV